MGPHPSPAIDLLPFSAQYLVHSLPAIGSLPFGARHLVHPSSVIGSLPFQFQAAITWSTFYPLTFANHPAFCLLRKGLSNLDRTSLLLSCPLLHCQLSLHCQSSNMARVQPRNQPGWKLRARAAKLTSNKSAQRRLKKAREALRKQQTQITDLQRDIARSVHTLTLPAA